MNDDQMIIAHETVTIEVDDINNPYYGKFFGGTPVVDILRVRNR